MIQIDQPPFALKGDVRAAIFLKTLLLTQLLLLRNEAG